MSKIDQLLNTKSSPERGGRGATHLGGVVLSLILAFPLMGKVALAEQVTDEVSNNNTASYLSLSITSSSSSSSTGSDNPDLYLQAPEGGGIATGWHTLSVSTSTSISKYSISMYGSSPIDTTSAVYNKATPIDMIPTTSTNTTFIKSLSGSNVVLDNNAWGYSLTKPDTTSQATLEASTWNAIPEESAPSTIVDGTALGTEYSYTTTIYYGTKTTNLTPADTYTARVVYTLTAELVPPSITSIEPTTLTAGDSETVSDTDRTITITGTNLATTYNVWVDLDNDGELDSSEACTNITLDTDTPNTKLTCIAPATTTPGTYNVYVETQGGVSSQSSNAQVTYEEVAKTIFSITTMQEMTTDICSNTTTPDSSATESDIDGSHTDDANYVPETSLTDTRDGTSYTIRKLADGNCWMVENLALGTDSEEGLTLTNKDTDLNSQTEWTLPAYDELGATWSSTANDAHIVEGSTTASSSWTEGVGNWYNWSAATAETSSSATSQGTDATDSICPFGWQLPYGSGSRSSWSTTSKSFGYLLRSYGYTSSSSTASSALRATPLSFSYSGYYHYSSGVGGVGSDGSYWTATAYSNSNAYLMDFFSSAAYPHDYGSRGYGLSVRCVAR